MKKVEAGGVDVLRRWMPAVALVVAIVAVVADAASWARSLVLVVPVAAFGAWERWPRLPLSVLILGVFIPVVVSQTSGHVEPAMFFMSLLAIVVARSIDPWWMAAAVGLAFVLSPSAIAALQPASNRIAWTMWAIGIAFPAVLGRALHSQDRLLRELQQAREQLTAQVQADERRRIARDVHDLVAHGLAVVLLQITSARHVLRTDIEAADEALTAAEEAGRRSMRELRGTVALLRTADESALTGPVPHPSQLKALVETFRQEGLFVEYQTIGDLDAVAPAVALALQRIAQEALLNAARHAAQAHTIVAVRVTPDAVLLEIDSIGRLDAKSERDRPKYGLLGMGERAASVGGELHAGPNLQGWTVRCQVPVAAP